MAHLFVSSESDCNNDIERNELSELKILDSGGFGTVYRGIWNKGEMNEQEIAAKYIIRKNTPESDRDFGRETNDGHISEIRGVQAYVDPKLLDKKSKSDHTPADTNAVDIKSKLVKESDVDVNLNSDYTHSIESHIDTKSRSNYTHTKESDIYSYGVLMWEIYTCRPPFQDRGGNTLTLAICLGERERHEIGMPLDYIKIYEKCWDQDPSFRPGISKILDDLKIIKPSPTYQEYNDALFIEPLSYVEQFDSTIVEELTQNYDEVDCDNLQIPVSLEISVNFDTFASPIKEAHNLFEEIKKSYDNAQLNIRICGVLIKCINSAECDVNNLQIDKRNHTSFATLENYRLFQLFLQNIRKIRDFIKNVSNIKGLKNYIQKTNYGFSLGLLKDEFYQLLDELKKSISSLKFKIDIEEQINDIFNYDIEETTKFIHAFRYNFDNNLYTMFKAIEETSARLIAKQKFSDAELLDCLIQEVDSFDTMNLKRYSSNQKDTLCIHAALFKNLENSVNIIKFYGILHDPLSGSMCLITNFYHSRLNSVDSENLQIGRDRIKTIAPEILSRQHHSVCKYDFRSEIYSFGIILWEILDRKNPYDVYGDDIYAIKDAILNNKRISWNFNNCMPSKYIDMMKQDNRPTICEMFKVLYDIVNNPENSQSCVNSSKSDFSQCNFSSIEDAVKEARKKGGNQQKALEYIKMLSEIGDTKASYYRGYFLQQNLNNGPKLSKYEYKKCQKEIARTIYRDGLAGMEYIEEGTHYLKLAAWGNYEKAIDAFARKTVEKAISILTLIMAKTRCLAM
ncbi:13612_t:CDS:2 [Dentiscutata erythropus]|uniref:13612_t:CDS:1 n=1 Tax=Dentiscutata erythropus TaxID=1348616 RepID=A0A9N9D9F3_9GLOM|nr:13612_t:CDS:2 [Dentiscutata erythropus]